jgi:hypothetical protein
MKRFPHIWKFNWRLIVLHIVVTFLLVLSTEQLSRLTAINLVNLVDKYGNHSAQHINAFTEFSHQLSQFYIWRAILMLSSFILVFILSMIISVRNKFSFLNALIVLIISFLAFRYGIFFNYFTRLVFLFPGSLIAELSLLMSFIVNGVYLFALSLFLLYSRFIKQHWVLRQQQKIARQLLDE